MYKRFQKIPCECNGRKFESLIECCREMGLNTIDIYKRKKKYNCSLNEALNYSYAARVAAKSKFKDHLGNGFRTLKEMCRYHGIDYNTGYARYKHGKDVSDVLYPGNLKEKDL